MAIGHLHATIVQRSAGQSAVSAAAYAARARMTDLRTGTIYDYSRKNADVMFSFVGLPKSAPERLRDPAELANAMEARETRKNSQIARKFIMALPDELTPKQREWLVKDFGRENFTRKGLAFHVAIHRPHEYGDQRNVHAHWTVSTRVMDKTGFTAKDRESNSREVLLIWRDNWEQMVNRQLERHGQTARISMKSLEAQGIDRTPQIHMGQGASALERNGRITDRGNLLRDIANDNEQETVVSQALEAIDRDQQDAAWQETIDSAGIAFDDERRRQFLKAQATDRAIFERYGADMLERHATTWEEVSQRHRGEVSSHAASITAYQPGTIAEAEQAASSGMSFFLSLFTSWAESIMRSTTGAKGQTKRQRAPDRAREKQQQREAEQQREAHTREIEAVLAEQTREREQYERRRALMLFEQAGALQNFEQQVGDKSSLREAFERHTEIGDAYQARAVEAERRHGRNSHDREGLGLG